MDARIEYGARANSESYKSRHGNGETMGVI
jgi:hypothetical protein